MLLWVASKLQSLSGGIGSTSPVKSSRQVYCTLWENFTTKETIKACLKRETVVFSDPKKVGSLNHGSYSNGELGPLRLIRSACKLVQECGCEKSGRMVSFATFMKETNQMDNLPLYPFLGNRFNILFLNGAGVFYLLSFSCWFFKQFISWQ